MPGSRAYGVSIAQAMGVNICVVLGEFTEVPLVFLQGLWMSSAVPLEASSWGPGELAGVSGLVMRYTWLWRPAIGVYVLTVAEYIVMRGQGQRQGLGWTACALTALGCPGCQGTLLLHTHTCCCSLATGTSIAVEASIS